MDEKHPEPKVNPDADFTTGAVEDGGEDMIAQQILPVWASTEPFGYGGSPADAQVVGGQPNGHWEPGKGHARRDTIGPGAD